VTEDEKVKEIIERLEELKNMYDLHKTYQDVLVDWTYLDGVSQGLKEGIEIIKEVMNDRQTS
jgi:hypothetical protein